MILLTLGNNILLHYYLIDLDQCIIFQLIK